jgi:uncharacterized protein YceK
MIDALMMRVFLLAAPLLLLAGCGTLLDAWNDSRIYGGVRIDVETVAGIGPADHVEASIPLRVLSVLDLPLSLVADTLILPYTVTLALLEPRRPYPTR